MYDPRLTALEQGYLDPEEEQELLEELGGQGPEWLERERARRGVSMPADEELNFDRGSE